MVSIMYGGWKEKVSEEKEYQREKRNVATGNQTPPLVFLNARCAAVGKKVCQMRTR